MKNAKEAVIEIIYLTLNQYQDIDRAELTEETRFENLGVDSLDKVEIILEIEKNLDTLIEDEAIETLETIGDLISYIEAKEHTIPETLKLHFINDPKSEESQEEEEEEIGEIKFLSSKEVEKIDRDLHNKIEGYINENIANWEECCECQEEGEALEFFLDHHYPSWRVASNGTIDVIVEGESRERFDFEWEDEDGESRVSNALSLLKGNVSHEFDEDSNNEIYDFYERGLKSKIKALFKS